MPKNQILANLRFLDSLGVSDFLEDKPRIFYKTKTIEHMGQNHNANLGEINNLEELRLAVVNFDGCDLKKTAKNTVFSDGNASAKIMIIGEAPGEEEDIQGIPFVGRAGKLLNKMLAAIELDRNKVYITNIVPWRPPGNRQPTDKEIILCLPLMQRHIELINPEILVLLGNTATKSLLMSDKGIMRLQGKWYEYSSYGLSSPIPTRAMFHPAFLLRSPSYKKQAWEDLLEIKKRMGT